jgi:hypothetical protein
LSLSDLRTPTRSSSGKKKAATNRDYAAESAEAEREQLAVRDRMWKATEERFRKASDKLTASHTKRRAARRGRGRGRGKGKGAAL